VLTPATKSGVGELQDLGWTNPKTDF